LHIARAGQANGCRAGSGPSKTEKRLERPIVAKIPQGEAEHSGARVRPRFRKHLMCLWMSITLMCFRSCGPSVYFIGFVMNGVLLSSEWFWAAGVLFASIVTAFLAGPDFYWLPSM
jgi:hypothetical protein